jgi:hypothetical protein
MLEKHTSSIAQGLRFGTRVERNHKTGSRAGFRDRRLELRRAAATIWEAGRLRACRAEEEDSQTKTASGGAHAPMQMRQSPTLALPPANQAALDTTFLFPQISHARGGAK